MSSIKTLWGSPIQIVQLGDSADVLNVALQQPLDTQGTLPGRVEDFNSPELTKFHYEKIIPAIVEFAKTQLGYHNTEPYKTKSWFFNGNSGGGLEYHNHPNSQITAIYYLTDSIADLVIYDPRANASRGYPPEVLKNHFSNYRLSPKAGDLVIIPAYLAHQVTPSSDQFRITLVTDYHKT